MNKSFGRFSLSLILIFSIFFISLPGAASAQNVSPIRVSVNDLQPNLQEIEEKLEKRRQELGIPGLSLAIVKDNQIIYLKGFGYKDYEKKVPVTPDTQFAIGSASKAFTALSVLMSQDDGKLSIDDNPKKYLPYFKINDAETDKNITVRDLLSHSSGLNRTDLGWITGKLTREEIIRVAGEAKPTAKLREKFQYQNVMFAAAGEIVAQVQKTPWEKFVADRIFKPLGMNNSNISISEMKRAKDYSFGYDYNFDTKETRRLPMRDLTQIAPAGSINSSARDMSQWVKFMLDGGSVNGKRLVSEGAFAELTKPQMKISGKMNYGFGWFLQDWNGLKVVQHGGNIDGFNSLVAMIPEKNLGFVLLTNVSGSSLGSELMPIVWKNILGDQGSAANQTAFADAQNETGKYHFEAAGFDMEIKMRDGKLAAIVPGQPDYILEKVADRKYKLDGAPGGFFVTFKDNGLYLEQPQGNYTLPKVKISQAAEIKTSDSAKELVGKYESEKNSARTIDISETDGKVSLVVEGQPPYELREKKKDLFGMFPLPDDYRIKAKRDLSGKLTGIAIVQPEGEFGFLRVESGGNSKAPTMTIEELMTKVVAALGGEANWRKLKTRVVVMDVDFVNQGVKGVQTQYAEAPNHSSSRTVVTALGKPIAAISEYFNGFKGGEETSFSPAEAYSGKQLEDVGINADFYGLINWRMIYKKAEIKGTAKIGGEDTIMVVIFEPEKGNKDTIYFSTKTFLPVRLESVNSFSTQNISLPYSETYSDYRRVDDVMIPFKTVNSSTENGDIVSVIKEIKHNIALPEKIFSPEK